MMIQHWTDNFLYAFDLTSLFIAFTGGLLIGVPTGPARFFVVDIALNEGRKAALKFYGGFFFVSFLYAALALLADDLISQNKRIESISYFIASLLLIFWGGLIVLRSNKKNRSSIRPNFRSWFIKGSFVGFSNPMTPFIYLTFIQLLKLYSNEVSLFQKAVFILLFELSSFVATSVVAFVLMKKRNRILDFWKGIKIAMGILLISFGIFSSFQQLDFRDGIKIKKDEGFIEEQIACSAPFCSIRILFRKF